MEDEYARDVARVSRIEVVPTILETVCRLTGMRFAAIARVTSERWIACAVHDEIDFGLAPGGELELETTICHEILQTGRSVIISDAHTDPAFRDHRTPAMYGFRSYISMPIILPDGEFFGTLCAIDPEERDLTRPEIQDVFKMFADLVGFHVKAADRMSAAEASLADEREVGEVREQFIAVLGHDLRNPLASVAAGVNLLRRAPEPPFSGQILEQMQSSIGRMTSLINNILDFARGRLGGGLSLDRAPTRIGALLTHVVSELAAAHPKHDIISNCAVDVDVECDADRIGQLLSNLIGNAVTHGAPGEPIIIDCTTSSTHLVITVSNGGDEIPYAARARLFQPFRRGQIRADREGLGLGLYIASQIVLAHDGTLDAVSAADSGTTFTARLPRAARRPAGAYQ